MGSNSFQDQSTPAGPSGNAEDADFRRGLDIRVRRGTLAAMNWKDMARAVRAALPAGPMRNRLAALAYRVTYGRALSVCAWRDGRFVVRTADGVEVRSVVEFDPAPLVVDSREHAPQPGEVALDVGANIGAVTCWMAARVGATGRVVAFEPDPDNLAVLRRNLAANQADPVTVVDRGAWDSEGELEFHAAGAYTSSFLRTDYVERDPGRYRTVRVPVTTIDAEADRQVWPRVDVIKMDIEGSEGPALRGARRTLERFHPRLIVETHLVQGRSTRDEVMHLLAAAGYRHIVERPGEQAPTLFAMP
jgi:FkbM family methyltransferase